MTYRYARATCLIMSLVGARSAALADPLTNVAAYQTSPGASRAGRVSVHGIFELTFTQPVDYGGQRNFDDIVIRAEFMGPDGSMGLKVGGFYYATNPGPVSLWKVRFAPPIAGVWTYNYTFTHVPTGDEARGTGSFEAQADGRAAGFLRFNPTRPFRWQLDDGRPFVPIGFNDCISMNDIMQIDGGDRFGAFGGAARTDDYLEGYAAAGFNMFRFSQDNCSPRLIKNSLASYDPESARFFDWLMQRLHVNGFHVFYGVFGNLISGPDFPPSAEVLRFIDYSINRWGAYVDVWELLNERSASAKWYEAVTRHIRETDLYQHPITTSSERPELDGIDINAPHWYLNDSELETDLITDRVADEWKRFDKPVIVGEQGNSTPQGEEYGNWLPNSAVRMRLRTWTALFREMSILFWNNSWATNGSRGNFANLYIGREERRYVRMLQWYSDLVIRPETTIPDPPIVGGFNENLIRAYGLASADGTAAYFHHYTDHEKAVRAQAVRIDIPRSGVGYWIDPATGANLGVVAVSAGRNDLIMPDFKIDLAFFSTGAFGIDAAPIALVDIENPQADGDLDNDGRSDRGPAEPPFGIAPLALTFDAGGSYDLDGGPLTYRWDFGDGSPPSPDGPRIAHTYPRGDFITSLAVTDDEGRTTHVRFPVRVSGDIRPDTNDPPTLRLLADVTVREGQLVLLTPWGVDSELIGTRYERDALTYTASPLPPGASFGNWGISWSEQFHWIPGFSQSGTYLVRFDVRDDDGAAAPPRFVTIEVLNAPRFFSVDVLTPR